MKTKILFIVCIFSASFNLLAQNKDTLTLNRTYNARVIEDYNTSHSHTWKDEIIFKNNRMYFTVFSKNWFFSYAPCTFSVDSISHTIDFTSEVQNSFYDIRKLSGTITGDSIKGTVIIYRADGVQRPYSFWGKIK